MLILGHRILSDILFAPRSVVFPFHTRLFYTASVLSIHQPSLSNRPCSFLIPRRYKIPIPLFLLINHLSLYGLTTLSISSPMDAILNLFTPYDPQPPQTLTPAAQAVLLQWRKLASQDPTPIDQQQIGPLVDDEGNRKIALEFRGECAATVINAIDRVMKEERVQYRSTTKAHAFKLMRKLAGASRQVPKSYLLGTFTRYTVEKKVIANGGFADIRRGRVRGMNVAVKTIRPTSGKARDQKIDIRRKTIWDEYRL